MSATELAAQGAGADDSADAGPLHVVNRFNAAWGAHDLAATLTMITEDCVFESTSPPDGERFTGPAAIAVAWRPIFDDTASVFTVEDAIVAGPHVITRWRYDWDGGHVRGIDIFVVRDGKVAAKIAYVKG
jgi:hypothetical protein